MSLSRSVVVLGWVSVVGVLLLARAAVLATPFSATEAAAWLIFGFAPVVIARFVVGGPASTTIAQVLYPNEPNATRGGLAAQSGSSRREGQS
jgi:hypothetical protein